MLRIFSLLLFTDIRITRFICDPEIGVVAKRKLCGLCPLSFLLLLRAIKQAQALVKAKNFSFS